MEFLDYYKILELERTAQLAEIKKAYRKLALKFHPDKNQSDNKTHDKFIQIQEAYEVLKDAEKKRKYDQLYDIRKTNQKKTYNYDTTSSNYSNYSSYDDEVYDPTADEEDSFFSSFFKHFFSRKKDKYNYSHLYKGKDIKGNITIDLEEAFLGSNRVVNVYAEKLRIKIKPGTYHQQVIKVNGKGAYSEIGTERGDLYIKILISPHKIFSRNGDNLYRDVNVGIYTAILGGKIQFETLHGKVIIAIPRGAKEGSQLRVKGKGMPKYDNPKAFGDLLVKIKYKMPARLTDEEISLLGKLKDISSKKGKQA
ncbi:MAG: DnaJ C-terminal domain-containing protein [Bacteroidales bacterium]|nr:DnaJ C-terminal domain-containing protein [Bacteroidales bacterium]